MSNRGMFIDALDQVLSERLDMVLIPLQKSDKISPTYEEIKAETEEFLMTLPEEGRDKYRMGLDTLFGAYRSYTFALCQACYIQGFKDFQQLLKGDLDYLDETLTSIDE